MQTSDAERAALAGRVVCWHDSREILVATLSGHIAAYPVSTEGAFSLGQPTTLVRDYVSSFGRQ